MQSAEAVYTDRRLQYNADLLESRYIRRSDPHFTTVPPGFEGKYEWVAVYSWDRKYEYCFAANFAHSSDVAVEIGVGTFHPFIYFLGSRCRRVYGVDLDERIAVLLAGRPTIIPIVANFAHIDSHIHEELDTAFSISALEHMEESDLQAGFRALYRLLKPGGLFVITFNVLEREYPNKWQMTTAKNPRAILNWSFEVGFQPAGNISFDFSPKRDICKNINRTPQDPVWLSCYRAVLVKPR